MSINTHTIRSTVSAEKSSRDLKDFKVIVKKKEVVRDALSISDIVQCNRVPVLRHIANAKLITDSQSFVDTASISLEDDDRGRNIVRSGSSIGIDISHRNKLALTSDKCSGTLAGGVSDKNKTRKVSDEENKLTLALEHMNNSKFILDSSRLMFEAALLFDGIKAYERASACYIKATRRVSAEIIVDTYDLPSDVAYKRKIERMSKFQLSGFLEARNAHRIQLITEENNRQRLRARAANCQLARIYLLTHLYNIEQSQQYISAAFVCCATDEEHIELLHYFHNLIKIYAAENKQEMSINNQLIRGCAGPIAESHINILHDLESQDGTCLDVLQWLGYRYAEKCDFEASKTYFKKVRDLTTPALNMRETLDLWKPKPTFDMDTLRHRQKTRSSTFGNDCEGRKVEETSEAKEIRESIKANINKGNLASFSSQDLLNKQSHGTGNSDPNAPQQRDYAWFRGKHEESSTVVYTIPKQGWNTVNI